MKWFILSFWEFYTNILTLCKSFIVIHVILLLHSLLRIFFAFHIVGGHLSFCSSWKHLWFIVVVGSEYFGMFISSLCSIWYWQIFAHDWMLWLHTAHLALLDRALLVDCLRGKDRLSFIDYFIRHVHFWELGLLAWLFFTRSFLASLAWHIVDWIVVDSSVFWLLFCIDILLDYSFETALIYFLIFDRRQILSP